MLPCLAVLVPGGALAILLLAAAAGGLMGVVWLFFYRISDVTFYTFLAWFWN